MPNCPKETSFVENPTSDFQGLSKVVGSPPTLEAVLGKFALDPPYFEVGFHWTTSAEGSVSCRWFHLAYPSPSNSRPEGFGAEPRAGLILCSETDLAE